MGSHRTYPIIVWALSALALSGASAQQPSRDEALAPAATRPVQQVLDEASANGVGAAKALDLAERALALAQQGGDVPGEAQAHRIRAQQLLTLSRTSEAIPVWREAEAAWKRAGDGPGQVEALGWQATLLMSASAEEAARLLERALTQSRAEVQRPRGVASSLVEIGRALLDRSFLEAGKTVYEAAIAIAERAGSQSLELAAGLNGLGSVAYYKGDLQTAGAFYRRALAIREQVAPDSVILARTFNNLGVVARGQGRLSEAREYYQRALLIQQKLSPDSSDAAVSLSNLGIIAHDQGDVQAAIAYQTEALRIHEKQVPNSPQLAGTFHNLGVALVPVDRAAAHRRFQQALAIRETLAAASLDVATTLTALGAVTDDLTLAAGYYRRAVALFEKTAPNSLAAVAALSNLGSVALLQGDLALARRYQLQALAVSQRAAPDTLNVAGVLEHLGVIAIDQGDLAAAQHYQEQSLRIRERLAPDSLGVAGNLNNLGNIARVRGDLETAREYQSRALKIRESVAPDSLVVAMSLSNLGNVARDEGDLATALAYHERALSLQLRLAPDSLTLANALENVFSTMREVSRDNSDPQHLQRAIGIRERIAPHSLALANSLAFRGEIAQEDGDIENATQSTARAWDIVRTQSATVAGDEAMQAFHSRYRSIGAQLVALQIRAGHTERAFATLEEGRAQALLQVMSQRAIARRLTPADVWRRHEIAQAASNRAGKDLERAGDAAARARLALEAEVALRSAADVIEAKQKTVAERERTVQDATRAYTQARIETEQRWAEVTQSIRIPVLPLAAADARQALPEGALFAAFSVGERGSTLFLVSSRGPIQAFPLAMSLQQLADRVKFVRETTSRAAGNRGLAVQGSDDIRVAAARTLFAQLFPPEARQAIANAGRLVVAPDGVLWDLPFAALVTNEHGKPRYLGLDTPLVYAQSLTAFAHAVRARVARSRGKPTALIIGNPLYDNALRASVTKATRSRAAASGQTASGKTRAQGELAVLSREGEIPDPLPYAEQEAQQIAALYAARAATGAEPTEAWFRQRAPGADVIHLATHGYFNQSRAVSSGLRLAVPELETDLGNTDNDGALQAWEVFTQLSLRAELVVLSACETGIGAQVSGEGLVGLTRAFQAVGAGSVVATQWKVADRSTAAAMVAFHQSLRRVVHLDEALSAAMRKLASDPVTSHPSYWAPFVLIGDVRPLGSVRSGSLK